MEPWTLNGNQMSLTSYHMVWILDKDVTWPDSGQPLPRLDEVLGSLPIFQFCICLLKVKTKKGNPMLISVAVICFFNLKLLYWINRPISCLLEFAFFLRFFAFGLVTDFGEVTTNFFFLATFFFYLGVADGWWWSDLAEELLELSELRSLSTTILFLFMIIAFFWDVLGSCWSDSLKELADETDLASEWTCWCSLSTDQDLKTRRKTGFFLLYR